MAGFMSGNAGIPGPTEQMAEMLADSDEIRKMSLSGAHPGIRQRLWGLQARTDPTVSFEEFNYWAKIEREMEEQEWRRYKAGSHGLGVLGTVKAYFTGKPYDGNAKRNEATEDPTQQASEKKEMSGAIEPIGPSSTHDYDAEWRQAARALRTTGWGGIFYLITTDILGWGQTPYVFANTGYGLGVGIFVLMGLAAAISAWMIWQVFLGIDSSRFPMLSYSDPFLRLCGQLMRHFINLTQAIQLLVTVAIVILGQTYIIAQLGESANFCFAAGAVIALVVGMASGYLRGLRQLGFLCNAAVWINVASFIIVCVAAAKYGPDPTAAVQGGVFPKEWVKNPIPVQTFIKSPPAMYQQTTTDPFAANLNGINSMVYAYSGAVFFPTFLAEMRHPMDFWKAAFLAQAFICVVYVFFGAFTYTYYGQYAASTITQTVKPLSLQIVSNILGLITGWLALFLYFNVAMKNIYLEVGQEVFKLPPIQTRTGKYLWWILGPIYFIIAFVIAMSIPQFSAFTNFIGGLFSVNFTYSLSAVMFVAFKIQQYAALPGEGFNPETGITTRHDAGIKRVIRGFMKGWMWTVPATLYAMAGLAASGMGTWAGVLALVADLKASAFTQWSCKNPFYNP